ASEVKHFLIDDEILKHIGDEDVSVISFQMFGSLNADTFAVRAIIIQVLLFLQRSRHKASAEIARQKAGQRKNMLLPFRFMLTRENIIRRDKQIFRDQRLMVALI